jgi:surface polysaccharide O-acyltransferase-like enzyme
MKALKKMMGRLNFFEKMLLLVGISVTVIGFYYINKIYTGEGHMSWALLQAAFLWLLLLFMIILTDSNESIKEELKEVIQKHCEETRILKEISKEQLAELKVIKAALMKKRK